MNLVEIYRELMNNPIKNSHTFYENRLFVCFHKGTIDLCMGKTSKDAESKFRQKHEIHMNDEVIVPFRVRFIHGPDKNINNITDKELDTKLHDIELISTKHTEYDFGYYSYLAEGSSFWYTFQLLIKELGGLKIHCRNIQSLAYLQQVLGYDMVQNIILSKT